MDRGWRGVSFIQYVHLSVFGNIYVLRTNSSDQMISSNNLLVLVNNIQRNIPFYDSSTGISIQNVGGSLQLTTNFGLVSLTFGGLSTAELSLDSRYSKNVCGLCGDGDGDAINDFVDRSNEIVPLVGDQNTKYFKYIVLWFLMLNHFFIILNNIDGEVIGEQIKVFILLMIKVLILMDQCKLSYLF